jgi:hypothetical protein
MNEIVFEAGPDGQIDGHFRERSLPLDVLQARFPGAELKAATAGCEAAPERAIAVVEAVLPHDGGFAYFALLADDPSRPTPLAVGRFDHSPFISFRWVKGAGEIYGRSPVMSASTMTASSIQPTSSWCRAASSRRPWGRPASLPSRRQADSTCRI